MAPVYFVNKKWGYRYSLIAYYKNICYEILISLKIQMFFAYLSKIYTNMHLFVDSHFCGKICIEY